MVGVTVRTKARDAAVHVSAPDFPELETEKLRADGGRTVRLFLACHRSRRQCERHGEPAPAVRIRHAAHFGICAATAEKAPPRRPQGVRSRRGRSGVL